MVASGLVSGSAFFVTIYVSLKYEFLLLFLTLNITVCKSMKVLCTRIKICSVPLAEQRVGLKTGFARRMETVCIDWITIHLDFAFKHG